MKFSLEKWRSFYIPSLAKNAADPTLARFLDSSFPSPYTAADACAYIGACLVADDSQRLYRAVVINSEAVGALSIERGSGMSRCTGRLGFWLAEPYRRRRVMSRAVDMLCREAFCTMKLERIEAIVLSGNKPCRRLLKSLGFKKEGRLKNSMCKNGKLTSCTVWALLREDTFCGKKRKKHK